MSNRTFAAAALVILSAASLAPAQETRGTVLGRVSDPSGAVIAGAGFIILLSLSPLKTTLGIQF